MAGTNIATSCINSIIGCGANSIGLAFPRTTHYDRMRRSVDESLYYLYRKDSLDEDKMPFTTQIVLVDSHLSMVLVTVTVS